MVRSLICYVVHWLMVRYFGISAAGYSQLKQRLAYALEDRSTALQDLLCERNAHSNTRTDLYEAEQKARHSWSESNKYRDALRRVAETKHHTGAIVIAKKALQ